MVDPQNQESSGGQTAAAVLVICRDLAAWQWWHASARPHGGQYVIASDDPRVHRSVQNAIPMGRAVFLEQMESFYAVAGEVIAILDRVNAWLARLETPEERGLLFWAQHCEGGDTTQRIQDALLLLRSIETLLDRERPARLVLVRCTDAAWEDELWVRHCTHRGVAVEAIGPPGWRRRVRRWWRWWRPLAKEVAYCGRVVRAKLQSRRGRPTDSGRTVVLQLCDVAKKHLGHTTPLLQALEEQGLHGVAACWGAPGAARILSSAGLRAEEIEAWVSWRDLAGSWWRTWRAWRAAVAARAEFLERDDCRDAVLVPVLWDSMRIFFSSEVPQRLRLHAAMRRFWTAYAPRAGRLWTRVLPQGVIAFRALPAGMRPLLFWQPGWPYQLPWPYLSHPVPADVIFALSAEHSRLLAADHVGQATQIVIAGLPWIERIRRFKQEHTPGESRHRLGVPEAAALVVFLDPGYFIRGYMAAAEQALLLEAMIDLARTEPGLHLIIKPHPSHTPGALEAIVGDYRGTNLTLVPQAELPYHALNAADVLVTKYSTLAIEAMVLGVPSIGAIFDGERRFACYGDAAAYVWEPAELKRLLLKIIQEPGYFQSWSEDLRQRSSAYLARHTAGLAGETNRIIAGHLKGILG